LFDRLLSIESDIERKLSNRVRLRIALSALYNRLRNLQSRRRAFQIAEQHYDPGQDVFAATLDPTMNYTCGYWEKAETLEQAQRDKMDMICRKLKLQKGERLLDIGCGWGGFSRYAAEQYGVEVVGVTVSKEQQKIAVENCRGLPVEIRLTDYRELTGTFDKIAVVGMFEHVGPKNYRAFFTKVEELLSREGLFLLHTIGFYLTSKETDPWIGKYIFPNSKLPSAVEITRAMEDVFLIEDWHNFGRHYDPTLMAWAERFDKNWSSLKERYSERFYRMWKYYLLSCAGLFRSGRGQLWQIVFSKRARRQEYRSKRNFDLMTYCQ
jgi:cyclopropane-fatty-acyl-phospholipid synthase